MSRGLSAIVKKAVAAAFASQGQTLSDGTVVNVEGNKASVQLGGPSSPALPGFVIPPSLVVIAGDHVQVYRQGGYQRVLEVLNRNALNTPAIDGSGSSVLETEDILWEGDTLADVQVVWEDDS